MNYDKIVICLDMAGCPTGVSIVGWDIGRTES